MKKVEASPELSIQRGKSQVSRYQKDLFFEKSPLIIKTEESRHSITCMESQYLGKSYGSPLRIKAVTENSSIMEIGPKLQKHLDNMEKEPMNPLLRFF